MVSLYEIIDILPFLRYLKEDEDAIMLIGLYTGAASSVMYCLVFIVLEDDFLKDSILSFSGNLGAYAAILCLWHEKKIRNYLWRKFANWKRNAKYLI